MNQNTASSGDDDLHLGNFARRLLVRKWAEGWFTPWERAYFEELNQGWWLTVSNVNTLQNKTGAKLITLLGKTDSDLIPALYAVEWVEQNPLEEFLGKLLAYFEKKWNYTIYEYIKVIRPWGNPNVYPMSLNRPLFHFLCTQYFTEYARNRYTLLELLEDFLKLEGVDINVLDNDGNHIFDMFEDYEMIQSDKNGPLLQLLADYGASWDYSRRWMVSGDGYILPREQQKTTTTNDRNIDDVQNHSEIGVGMVDPYLNEYHGYPNRLWNQIDDRQ